MAGCSRTPPASSPPWPWVPHGHRAVPSVSPRCHLPPPPALAWCPLPGHQCPHGVPNPSPVSPYCPPSVPLVSPTPLHIDPPVSPWCPQPLPLSPYCPPGVPKPTLVSPQCPQSLPILPPQCLPAVPIPPHTVPILSPWCPHLASCVATPWLGQVTNAATTLPGSKAAPVSAMESRRRPRARSSGTDVTVTSASATACGHSDTSRYGHVAIWACRNTRHIAIPTAS